MSPRPSHPFSRFGPANLVTAVRAGLVAVVLGLIAAPVTDGVAWTAAVFGLIVMLLDGVDGWLARRTGLSSPFGARFDMEVDALLILALAGFVWRHDKTGAWVLASGALRYAFVVSGYAWVWMREPLPPSRRRQAICVVQIVALLLAILPPTPGPVAWWLAATSLILLLISFAIDVAWLSRRGGARGGRWMALSAALIALNLSLTFHNIWPTPAIRWHGELSVELAVWLLAFVLARVLIGPPSRLVLGGLSAAWVLLVVGRYAEVTAPALYGRDINLYWDAQYMPDVAAMLARAAPVWLVAAAVASAGVIALALFLTIRWSLARVADALTSSEARLAIGALAAAVLVLFAGQRVSSHVPALPAFATPVVATYARQARLIVDVFARSALLPQSPAMDSDLSLVGDTDVLLLFVESYGAATFDRPEFSAPLASGRARLEGAIRSTERQAVSAFVGSPTFGGSSWLAHLSLMTGVEVREPGLYARLMAEPRATLPTVFQRHGYRSIAIMPGLWYQWPEGAFYGFDDIYGGYRLDYKGPDFGWWGLPDQFALARLDELTAAPAARAPLFVFLPTVSTHTPFVPTPPYQPDWTRMLTDRPYDAVDADRALGEEPDWLNLGPSYVGAVSYSLRAIAGYLELRPEREFILILVGDHQAPAAVSGESARWDVPVHVIAKPATRGAVLERLIAHGFRPGLTPATQPIGHMHELLPVLLDAFGK